MPHDFDLPPLLPDHPPQTRLVFGIGAIEQLGELAHELGARRALLVSDPGVTAAGHTTHGADALEAAGVQVAMFTEAHENPTTEDVDACVAAARDARPDVIIGLGGGSALDTAKGCNFVLTNGGAMADYAGIGKAKRPLRPFIAVPTTHGTGSETQSFALIADATTRRKMACGDPKALPQIALLDPSLTRTQPPRVAACTAIDAITHAVESFVCTKRNGVSCAYARASLSRTLPNFKRIFDEPRDLDARGELLLGAAYAGLAIEHSMLGAAHAAANPLTARFEITHGHAVGLMLPHVITFNAEHDEARAWYDELAAAAGLDDCDALLDALRAALRRATLEPDLGSAGVPRDALDDLAADAATQWTGTFNPRALDVATFRELYERAFGA